MKEGDRVLHKKLGRGTVKKVYGGDRGVRVQYDSGHETTNGESRLRILTPGQAETDAPAAVTPTPAKRVRNSGVDYARIDKAVEQAKKDFPDADEINGRVYGHRVYVEVWQNHSAKIVFYEV